MGENPAIKSILRTMAAYNPPDWSQMPDLELYMDQVITYLKRQLEPFQSSSETALITPSIINNYVKDGIISRPVNKKYARPQLGALTMACILKRAQPMQGVKRLLNTGGMMDEDRYARFFEALDQVIDDEASQLAKFADETMNDDQLMELAMRFSMRASVDCLIADRLLDMTRPLASPVAKGREKPAR